MKEYKKIKFESEVYFKLSEAEREAKINSVRYSAKDVLSALKKVTGEDK